MTSTSAPASRLTPKKLYRIVAIAEAITWTLLITGLILRATAGLDIAVTIGGSIHGFVFLAYGATAVLTAINQRWGVGLGLLAVVTAVIPYATIPFDIWAHRTGRLEGDWRREATDDPRDQRWFDRLVRWMLKHPYLLAALILLAVVVLFTVLLILGPPVPKS
ncbi:MAG: DUF3817 domain-containing protein [Microcella sp.]